MSAQILYLALVIAAFGLFALSLLGTSVWAKRGERKATKP